MNVLKKCKACGTEIPKGAKNCPNCGADQSSFFGKHKIITAILVVALLGGLGSAMGGGKDDKSSTSSNSTSSKPSTQTSTSNTNNQEQYDFSNATLTKENISKALDAAGLQNITKVDFKTENNKNIIDVSYNPGDVWDSKDLVKNSANQSTKIMEVLFKNKFVDKVWVWTATKMIDSKGNESVEDVINVSLTKENAKNINWSNFEDMVMGDYNALYKVADSHYIAPGVLKDLK